MNKQSITSFVLGVCCTVFVGVISNSVQRVRAQSNAPSIGGAEPVVPPGSANIQGITISGFDVQQLDGINCSHCTLLVPKLTYAGGVFSCNQCKIATRSIELRGAAWNTFNALKLFGIIPQPQGPRKPAIQKDPIQKALFEIYPPQDTVNWVSADATK
jgi:hypothetical protein